MKMPNERPDATADDWYESGGKWRSLRDREAQQMRAVRVDRARFAKMAIRSAKLAAMALQNLLVEIARDNGCEPGDVRLNVDALVAVALDIDETPLDVNDLDDVAMVSRYSQLTPIVADIPPKGPYATHECEDSALHPCPICRRASQAHSAPSH
jgi:hypothetical protein